MTVFNGQPTVDVLNALRTESSTTYQTRVPLLADDNFKQYAHGVLSDFTTMNEWANNLVNRIGKVVLRNRSWENPLKVLKKGTLEMGDTIEEVFTGLVKEQVYKPTASEQDAGLVYKSAVPPIYAVFHKVNRKGLYEVSFNETELKRAFVSMRSLEDFIANIYNTLYNSDELDEFLYMKKLLTNYAEKGLFHKVNITAPTNEQTAKDLITKVKAMSTKFSFITDKYNAFNVPNHAKRDEQIIFISADLDALVDVNVLASAFNMDKTNFLSRRIVLDEMPIPNAHVILSSEDLLMVYDTLFDIRSQENPRTLEWKYFLHHHQVLSTSRFENAVIFTSDTVSVPTAITLARATAEDLLVGNRTQIVPTVKAGETTLTNYPVLWELEGRYSADTIIDENGYLHISPMETAETIVVKAYALHYADVVGSLEVTIG